MLKKLFNKIILNNFYQYFLAGSILIFGPNAAVFAANTERGTLQSELQPVILLTDAEERVDLRGKLAVFRDPTGFKSIQDVCRSGASAFEPISDHLSLGFTRDVVWLRMVIERPVGTEADRWWLMLNQALLQYTELYKLLGDARQSEGLVDLCAKPEVRWALPGRRAVYELDLMGGGPQTVFIRLQSQASLSVVATLWKPSALEVVDSNESFIWGGVFGAYALIIIFYLAFWAWTREWLYGSYVLYILCNFMAAFFTGGWPRQLFPWLTADAMVNILGFWITLPMLMGSWFTVLFLGLHTKWPRASRVFLSICAVIVVVSVPLIFVGYYQPVVPVMQALSIFVIGGIYVVSFYLAVQGDRSAQILLAAFSFFYAGVVWRYLRNIGLLEPNVWNDNSYQFGAFVHMLVMSIGIFSTYGRLRRQSEDAEARIKAEAGLREEQRDFMAMVSHEFRAPLSIVSASTSNLLNDAQLLPAARERVQKIVRANDRMSSLMEQYLANERLLLDGSGVNLETHNLVDILQRVCEDHEQPGAEAPVLRGMTGLMVRCDARLVGIALNNLLVNARRHSPPGVPVEVDIGVETGQAYVCVRDRGEGVPPDDLDQVFKRFYRGRNALDLPGSGLGLYLVRAIATRHGGSVAVRNLQPAGCEFVFHLPLDTSLSPRPDDLGQAVPRDKLRLVGRRRT